MNKKMHTKGNDVGNRPLDDQELEGVVGGTVSLRASTGISVARQTPRQDFGDRMAAGLETAAGAVANGAAVVGGMVPGAGIISAAVSSVSNLAGASGGGTAGGSYAATG
jgi:hypothetical protein